MSDRHFTLVVLDSSDNEVFRASLISTRYVFGSGADCDIVLPDSGVSPRQGALIVAPARVWLMDFKSQHNTYLEGERVHEVVEFERGQEARMGGLRLRLLDSSTSSDSNSTLMDSHQSGRNDIRVREEQDLPNHARFSRHHLPSTDELQPELTTQERFIVEKQLARGGMGIVYEARDLTTLRKVAMKVMVRENDPVARLRFVEEAQVTAQLEHPNIVPLHELGVDGQGHLFYVMKLVKGITLQNILTQIKAANPSILAKYSLSQLLTVFQKVCDALAFAHSRGVIHRDLKPANIMIGLFGEVMVMDWGLAKIAGPGKSAVETQVRGARGAAGNDAATIDGVVLGTPMYMSPEQARGEVDTLDERSDIYSLGALLYEILTLTSPIKGRSAADVIVGVKSGRITPPEQVLPPARGRLHLPHGSIPQALSTIAMRCLSAKRESRFQTVTDLQQDIAAFQNGFATNAERGQIAVRIRLFIRRYREQLALIAVPAFALAWFMVYLARVTHGDHLREQEGQAATAAALKKAHINAEQSLAKVLKLKTMVLAAEPTGRMPNSLEARALMYRLQGDLETLYKETEPVVLSQPNGILRIPDLKWPDGTALVPPLPDSPPR